MAGALGEGKGRKMEGEIWEEGWGTVVLTREPVNPHDFVDDF
jgi:hypothetical protein